MIANISPIFGVMQPGVGAGALLHCLTMAKPPKTPGMLRTVVARNLRAELDRKYGSIANQTNKTKALGRAVQMSPETVRRILKGKVGLNLETLETFAEALNVAPYRLLQPSEEVRRKFEVEERPIDSRAPMATFKTERQQQAPPRRIKR